MHLLLTDLLTCPRCGPAQGLIVFSQRMEERRILEGVLGCPNCETQYPIRGGLADLRLPDQAASWGGEGSGEKTEASRLAALLGITEGPGFVLLLGARATGAAEIAAAVPGLEVVVAVDAPDAREQRGVNRLRCAEVLPLRAGSMRGVAVLTDVDAAALSELVRLLGPGARLVAGSAHDNEELERMGLRVLARAANTVVAQRVA